MVVALHHRGAGLDRRLGADVAMTDGAVVDVYGDEPARIITVDRPDVLAVETDVPDPLGRLREGDVNVEPWLHHVGVSFRGPGWEDTGHRASGAARGTGTPPRVLGDAAVKTLPGHNANLRMKSRASRASTATQEATQPGWRRTGGHGPSGRPLLSVVASGGLTSARIGYAGNGSRSAQVSQVSWPRRRLLGVALHACPTAQISGAGDVVPL